MRMHVCSKVDPDRDRSKPTTQCCLIPESQNQNQRQFHQFKIATAKPITDIHDLLNVPYWRHAEVNGRWEHDGTLADSRRKQMVHRRFLMVTCDHPGFCRMGSKFAPSTGASFIATSQERLHPIPHGEPRLLRPERLFRSVQIGPNVRLKTARSSDLFHGIASGLAGISPGAILLNCVTCRSFFASLFPS